MQVFPIPKILSEDHVDEAAERINYYYTELTIKGSSRFVVNDPAVAGIHATVFAALVSRIRIR